MQNDFTYPSTPAQPAQPDALPVGARVKLRAAHRFFAPGARPRIVVPTDPCQVVGYYDGGRYRLETTWAPGYFGAVDAGDVEAVQP